MQASRSKIACCIIDWLRMLKFHHTLLQYNLHSWVHIFTKELRWGPALKRTKFILFKENYSKFCFRMQLCGSHCYSTILFPHATVNSNKIVLPDVGNLRFHVMSCQMVFWALRLIFYGKFSSSGFEKQHSLSRRKKNLHLRSVTITTYI